MSSNTATTFVLYGVAIFMIVLAASGRVSQPWERICWFSAGIAFGIGIGLRLR